jgi:hypothetical protein
VIAWLYRSLLSTKVFRFVSHHSIDTRYSPTSFPRISADPFKITYGIRIRNQKTRVKLLGAIAPQRRFTPRRCIDSIEHVTFYCTNDSRVCRHSPVCSREFQQPIKSYSSKNFGYGFVFVRQCRQANLCLLPLNIDRCCCRCCDRVCQQASAAARLRAIEPASMGDANRNAKTDRCTKNVEIPAPWRGIEKSLLPSLVMSVTMRR